MLESVWNRASQGGKLHEVATEQVVGACLEEPYGEFRLKAKEEAMLELIKSLEFQLRRA